MKIAHWTLDNGSGLHRVAESIAAAEKVLGYDSSIIVSTDSKQWEMGVDADIHVVHSHLPDIDTKKGSKTVWIGHGTPEHCFQISIEEGLKGGYAPSDSWMICQYWLQHADALVTFWPRHQAVWKSLCDKNTEVHCIPMGVDKGFWSPQESRGKFAGTPSLYTAENCHSIKWPLDLLLIWPWVTKEIKEARLHAHYIPRDQHRWWFPLVNRNGAAFKSYISGGVFSHSDLRNAFSSIDYYIGLVRYGDFNRIGLEAKATGAKVISYKGNPYADYWITEGDQREMAKELIAILKGDIVPRETLEVPDIKQTAEAMIEIYKGL